MSRLPFIKEDDLDPKARETWDQITGGDRGTLERMLTPEGGLYGPFNAMLYNPRLGRDVARLGGSLRFRGQLSDRIRELAILIAGAHWKADFEFWAHRNIGLTVGLSEAEIEAIRTGGEVPLTDTGEVSAVAFARELLASGKVSDSVYAEAANQLGEAALVELVYLVGYYCLISLSLNAFGIGLPEGEDPIFGA